MTELKGPFGIALNAEGTIAVSDFYGHSVYVFDSEGTFLRKIGQFKQPVDAVFVNDDEILVSDHGDHRIYQYSTRSGLFIKEFGKPGTRKGKLKNPLRLSMDDKDQIVVSDYNNRIQVLAKNGENIFLRLETVDRKNSFIL